LPLHYCTKALNRGQRATTLMNTRVNPEWPITVCGFTREGEIETTRRSSSGRSQERPRSLLLLRSSRSYCNFLLHEAYDSAYASLSDELRGTVSQAEYVRAHERIYASYGGRPLSNRLYSVPFVYTGRVPKHHHKKGAALAEVGE
jgi:hypothetical protein